MSILTDYAPVQVSNGTYRSVGSSRIPVSFLGDAVTPTQDWAKLRA
jgi:hypothetical protein